MNYRLTSFLLFLLAHTSSHRIYADTYEIPDSGVTLTYISSNGEITIQQFSAESTVELLIPDTIENLPVTAIDSFAFSYAFNSTSAEYITQVTFPSSINSIGFAAFQGCENLNKAIFQGDAPAQFSDPTLIPVFGDLGVFHGTADDFGIVFYNGAAGFTTPTWQGYPCLIGTNSQFTTILENGQVTITGCENSVTGHLAIPKQIDGHPVVSIGNSAFSGCSALASLSIPDSIVEIGDTAFSGCSSLVSIYFEGNAPELLGNNIFNGVASEFSISFSLSATGFTTPTWLGQPSQANIQEALTYVIENEQITILDCDENITGDIAIPATIDGRPVVKIDDRAFENCNSISSVFIPASISQIGFFVFGGCGSLMSIQVDPQNQDFQSIGTVLFDKSAETLIQYPRARTGPYTIPNSVSRIEDFAFANCLNLPALDLPNSITYLGEYSFSNCDSLTTLRIPSSVSIIDDFSFKGCDALREVIFQGIVDQINTGAFSGCGKLRSALFQDQAPYNFAPPEHPFFKGVFDDAHDYFKIEFYEGAQEFTAPTWVYDDLGHNYSSQIVVPEYLSYQAYGDHVVITDCDINTTGSVFIPSSIDGLPVTTIGDSAFLNCDSIENIILPDTITAILDNAFSNCGSLSQIQFKGKAPSNISDQVFGNTNALTVYYYEEAEGFTTPSWQGLPCEVYVPPELYYRVEDGYVVITGTNDRIVGELILPSIIEGLPVTEIYGVNGDRISSITIPRTVAAIGDNAFNGCYSASHFEVSSLNPTYESVDGVIFDEAKETLVRYPIGSNDLQYTIPSSVITISNDAFHFTNLTDLTFPNTVEYIGSDAFARSDITNFIIPDSVEYIGSRAFQAAPMTSLRLPNTVNYIGSHAFMSSNLVDFVIPDSVTTIGASAFAFCEQLTSVHLGNSTAIILNNTFQSCDKLVQFTVNDENTAYTAVDGVLFDKDIQTLIQYPVGRTGSYRMPNSVTMIAIAAFELCLGLTSIELSVNLQQIGPVSFRGCTGLKHISIPASVHTIANQAFSNCSNLIEVHVEGDPAPYNCPPDIFDGVPESFRIYHKPEAGALQSEPWSSYTQIAVSNVDSDGDGWTDWMEEQLGTDPESSLDKQLVWLNPENDSLTLVVRPWADNCTYDIEWSDDNFKTWYRLDSTSFSGSVTEGRATLPFSANESAGFYRIVILKK